MLQFMLRPLRCLDRWTREHGDPFTLARSEPDPWIFFGAPDAVRTIFRAEPGTFEDPRKGDRALRFLFGEHSIMRLGGEAHRQERRMLTPHFQLPGLATRMADFDRCLARASTRLQPGQSFTARTLTQDLTLRFMTTVLFGSDEDGHVSRIRARLTDLMGFLHPMRRTLSLMLTSESSPIPFNPWRRLRQHRDRLNEALYSEIQARHQGERRHANCILNTMLDEVRDGHHALPDIAIRDELMTLLFAGHETTASAMAWTLYFIHANPQVQERLRSELDAVPADAPATEFLDLPYLSAVVAETLRIYPGPIATPRTLLKPLHIAGYNLAAGSTVIPCVHMSHRRESVFPDPETFDPTRFLDRKYSVSEYWPFADGHRKCIGMQLALLELKVGVASILRQWEFQTLRGPRPEPIRCGGLISPPPSLRLVPVQRRTALHAQEG